jgi:hypothetical protein
MSIPSTAPSLAALSVFVRIVLVGVFRLGTDAEEGICGR